MAIWFEGESHLAASLEDVARSLDDPGAHHVGLVEHMPGMIEVVLVDAGEDRVTIRTNEGLMERTGIERRDEADRISVDYDETYQAGSRVTAHSHFAHVFTRDGSGVHHHLIVSDVDAGGVLGFLYRHLGRRRMGRAFLEAHEAHFAA